MREKGVNSPAAHRLCSLLHHKSLPSKVTVKLVNDHDHQLRRLTHVIKNNLCHCIHIHDLTYNLRGCEFDMQLSKPKTNTLKRSLAYRGATGWNALSNHVRDLKTLSSFKAFLEGATAIVRLE